MGIDSSAASCGESTPELCTRAGHCPLCGGPNGCRLETGEGYKGPCWCERPTVDAAALRRLLGDLLSPRCLCSTCLARVEEAPGNAVVSTLAPEPSPAPLLAREGDFYWEGAAMVFTGQYHLRRGSCCGSGCRHCPYRGR